jgi:hypothetical protein
VFVRPLAAQPGQHTQVETPDLVLTGSIAEPTPTPEQTVQFWLTVTNRSATATRDLRLAGLDSPGFYFRKDLSCWCSGGVDACWSAPQPSRPPVALPLSCDPIAAELKPGSVVSVWGYLSPANGAGTTAATARVSWIGEQGPSRVAVPLGIVRVPTWAENFRSNPIVELVHDFALPVVVAVFGGLFGYWFQKREKKSTQLAETWSQMLPQSHEYATKYYMSLESALSNVITQMGKMKEKPGVATTEQLAFYFWLLYERRLRHLTHSVAGFYFKDRSGEELAVYCSNKYDEEFRKLSTERDLDDLSSILDKVEVNETFHEFRTKLQSGVASAAPPASLVEMVTTWVQPDESKATRELFQRTFRHFKRWVDDPSSEKPRRYLGITRAVIKYEMNRPYEYWYGKQERLELDPEATLTLHEILRELEGSPNRDEQTLAPKIRQYLRSATTPAGVIGGFRSVWPWSEF